MRGSRRVLTAGAPGWARVRDLAAAWGDDRARDPEREGGALGRNGRELAEFGRGLGRADLWPEALLSAADLGAAGLAPGPRYGELLAEAEEARLQGLLPDREAALAWLGERVS